jgi:diamine N-acetyltransferase
MRRGRVRRAVAADAGLLSVIGERTFRETFAVSNTEEDMASYLAESFGPAIQSAEIAEPGTYFLILEIDGEAAGYARLSFGAPPPGTVLGQTRVNNPLEIVRFYIDRRWHGQGAAAELMESCLVEGECHGVDLLWLAVWEQNPRAIAFYRKSGFVVAGRKIFQLGSDAQTDLVMIRSLQRFQTSG